MTLRLGGTRIVERPGNDIGDTVASLQAGANRGALKRSGFGCRITAIGQNNKGDHA